jgi:hypothetical protein
MAEVYKSDERGKRRMIDLRVLSKEGIDRFREYIQIVKENPRAPHPDLNLEPYSYEFQPRIKIDETKLFMSRIEMAKYLKNTFEDAGIGRNAVIGRSDLWSWLAYLWFDQLCPIVNGGRKLNETARYICSSDYTDYYRHYVAASYDIYSIHGEPKSKLFLYGSPYLHSDFIEQFASRQNIISNSDLVEVAYRLYWETGSNHPKRGAQSRSKPGNHRRLLKIIDQLELTYDVFTMTADEIINLLPCEFDDWLR